MGGEGRAKMTTAGIHLTAIDLLILFAYLVGTLWLGSFCGRFIKSSDDFLLAGKSLPFWAAGMSIVATDIGVMDMVSGAGAAYQNGMAQANFDWLGSVPALIIVGFIFVPFYWRAGVSTVPEFLGRRFGEGVRWFQAAVWLFIMVVNLAIMLWMSGLFLGTVLDWNPYVAIWITVVGVGIYTYAGGLTAVVMTDVIQLLVLFVGSAALLALSYWKAGGAAEMARSVGARGPEFANHFKLLLPHNTTTSYPWSGILFGLGMVMSTSYFATNQAVIQRVFGTRSEWDAKASMIVAGGFKLLVPLLITFPGLTALALYPKLEKADYAMPTLVRQLLPPGLMGLIIAAFFSALMSNVSGYLNSSTTVAITDFYQPVIRFFRGREASAEHCLKVGRGLTVGLVLAAGLGADFVRRFETIYNLIQTMMSFIQGPTLALLLLGIFWRRANSLGALAGILSGFFLAVALNLVGTKLFRTDNPFLFVSVWSFLFSLGVTVAVSLCGAPPPPERIRGLVYGMVDRDPEAQALLRERLDPPNPA
jgi:SSS family solute:Na+ symporter